MKRIFICLSCFLCLLVFCSGCYPNKPNDMLTGKNMIARDGSLLQMKDDGTYIWYQKPEVTDDNYYVGTYEIYFGENAINILDSMEQYDFTREKQLDSIARNVYGYTKDDWYVMVQNVKERVVNGTRKDSSDKVVYAGFYNKNKNVYESVNCNTSNYAEFSVEKD